MKKSIALLLTLVLLVGLFAGCNKDNNQNSVNNNNNESKQSSNNKDNNNKDKNDKDNEKNSNEDSDGISAPGEFPIVEETVTLEILHPKDAEVSDYEDNKLTKYMEELTNVDIKWQLVPSKDMQNKINLMLGSGSQLPEVIMGHGFSLEEQILYGEQGIFLPLNEYIDEQGVEFKKMMIEREGADKLITSADGNIYALPKVNSGCYNCPMSVKFWMYMPFLDTLGLDKPNTTDEFYDTLKKIVNDDPNGNGEADEIGVVGATTGWHQNPFEFLLNAFVYYDHGKKGMYLEDGEVRASIIEDGFKEGLLYMKKLVDEGLMDPVSFTQDASQLKQLVESEEPIVGSLPSGGPHVFGNINGERVQDYDTIAPLEGPSGLKVAWYDSYWAVQGGTYVITKACENPEVAYKFADYMYSLDYTLRARFGEPGTDYIEAKDLEGKKGWTGEQAMYEPILEWGSVQKSHWQNRGPAYMSWEGLKAKEAVQDGYSLFKVLTSVSERDYAPYLREEVLPNVSMGLEESREFAEIGTEISQYYQEEMVRFVLGDKDIDNEWDAYVKQLEAMGLNRYVELYQVAYDNIWK